LDAAVTAAAARAKRQFAKDGDQRGRGGSQLSAGVRGEFAQNLLPARRELYENLAAVFGAAAAGDEAFAGQTVEQFDSAVVLNLQALSQVADARLLADRLSLDGKHDLILLWLDAGPAGGVLAESLEAADLIAKVGQGLVIGERDTMVVHKQLNAIISYCDI
jgi:hypothetical protein